MRAALLAEALSCKKIPVIFKASTPGSISTTINIRTKLGVFGIQVTATAILPTVLTSSNLIDFGVVGVKFPIKRKIKVTNTCILPLELDFRYKGKFGEGEVNELKEQQPNNFECTGLPAAVERAFKRYSKKNKA